MTAPPPYGYDGPPPQGYGPPAPQGYGPPAPQGYGPPAPQGYGPPAPQGYGPPNTTNTVIVNTAASSTTIVERNKVNHCLHCCISIFFPFWIIVWICLCLCN